MNSDIIGFSGTALLSITLLPQVIKTYSEKDTRNLSSLFLLLQFLSNIIFIYYGFLIESIPVIASNSIVILCTTSLLLAKVKYKTNDQYNIIV